MLTSIDKDKFVAAFSVQNHAECSRIIARCLLGDVTRRYGARLRDNFEAEELAQGLFAIVVAEIHALRDPLAVEAWFWQIADRHLINQRKKATREIPVSQPENHVQGRSPILGKASSSVPFEQEERRRFTRGLARLKPTDAAIMALRLAGWTNHKIAELFNVTVDAIKKRAQRAAEVLGRRGNR